MFSDTVLTVFSFDNTTHLFMAMVFQWLHAPTGVNVSTESENAKYSNIGKISSNGASGNELLNIIITLFKNKLVIFSLKYRLLALLTNKWKRKRLMFRTFNWCCLYVLTLRQVYCNQFNKKWTKDAKKGLFDFPFLLPVFLRIAVSRSLNNWQSIGGKTDSCDVSHIRETNFLFLDWKEKHFLILISEVVWIETWNFITSNRLRYKEYSTDTLY